MAAADQGRRGRSRTARSDGSPEDDQPEEEDDDGRRQHLRRQREDRVRRVVDRVANGGEEVRLGELGRAAAATTWPAGPLLMPPPWLFDHMRIIAPGASPRKRMRPPDGSGGASGTRGLGGQRAPTGAFRLLEQARRAGRSPRRRRSPCPPRPSRRQSATDWNTEWLLTRLRPREVLDDLGVEQGLGQAPSYSKVWIMLSTSIEWNTPRKPCSFSPSRWT